VRPSTAPVTGLDEASARARHHGGPEDDEVRALVAALRATGRAVIDFSVNLNPYGPAPEMVDAIRAAAPAPYPDPTARPAREALAAASGCDPARVVVGPGAAELLWTAARALIEPGQVALVVEPTFSEVRHAVEAARGQVRVWRTRPERDFAPDGPAIAAEARRSAARLVCLGNPNNPTGAAWTPAALTALTRALLPGTTVISDESFLSLSEAHADGAAPLPESIVRVRSLTKDHAIAGVRAGYLIASEGVAALLERQRPPWSVSASAQAAALASTRLGAFVADSRARVLADRRALEVALVRLGFTPLPSTTCFSLVAVPPPLSARELRRRLLGDHGILVRDCTSFGLPGHVRLAARPAGDRAALIAALAAVVRSR
jgi:histidinol-phosphate/aromatic aminotransferase/cobyric acid decarboxylase-like protein